MVTTSLFKGQATEHTTVKWTITSQFRSVTFDIRCTKVEVRGGWGRIRKARHGKMEPGNKEALNWDFENNIEQ